MEEIEVQAIKKVIENIEWERDHWGPDCNQCRYFPEVLHTTSDTNSICIECAEREEQRLQKNKRKINKMEQ